MRFLRALRCDLNKTIVNIGFVGAVLLTAMLCFTAVIYYDGNNDKSYSAVEVFFDDCEQLVEHEVSFSSLSVFCQGMKGYITMFLPIIVSFPFMVSFCAERNSGLIRAAIARTGELRYCLSKFTASFLSGGLAALLGYVVFGAVTYAVFPGVESYGLTRDEFLMRFPKGMAMTILLSIFAAFIYGAVSTLPAFFLSSFCRDPYLITCVPFLMVYLWRTLIDKLGMTAAENGKFELSNVYYSFYPEAITGIITTQITTADLRRTIIFNVGLFVFAAVGATIIFRLRQDKGR